jgi:hypothetical protein
MILDAEKNYKTERGDAVKIYATNGGGRYPVHGAVRIDGKGWRNESWTAMGKAQSGSERNLQLDPTHISRSIWINVHDRSCVAWISRDKADRNQGNRLACIKVKIDCHEGAGLWGDD